MEWAFEKYPEKSTRQDSSSDKFFHDAVESDSLIREFIQNALDAVSDKKKPVKVVIRIKQARKETLKTLFDDLKLHLKACDIQIDDYNQNCVVLEDFNTKGLEGAHLERFFRADNITDKTEGGGSHGIGKSVFSISSRIRAFLGYSQFGDNQSVFQGRAVLKTHKIGPDEFRPYGDLEIPVKDYERQISEIFKRKAREKGLSVAIPCCDITIENIKRSCLEQFYMPIINKKLAVTVGNEEITNDTLLKYIGESSIDIIKHKINLAMEYKTTPPEKIKEYRVKKADWKKQKFPQLGEQELKNQNQPLFIKFKIELPVKQGPAKYGSATLLIKKMEETAQKDQDIDCWRDSLLISSALGYSQKDREYSAIFLIESSPLSQLLRGLEDPGHRKWQTGKIKDELKEKYKNIPDFIQYVKKLPAGMIRQIKHPPLDRDINFFAEYFPETSSPEESASHSEKGSGGGGGGAGAPEIEPTFQNFTYRPNIKGDGFTLRVKNKEEPPEQITVRTAYGTNRGSAFNNYDERDFDFGKNITVQVNHGEQICCEKNRAQYSITDKEFSINFQGFDPDRELKIDVE